MSLNSVQSFVIDNCNGPLIENGLNSVCLHPLSSTFTLSTSYNNNAQNSPAVIFTLAKFVLINVKAFSQLIAYGEFIGTNTKWGSSKN